MTRFSDLLAEIRGEGECIQLIEKLLMIKQGAKYGQVVFLSGGAASGKGFAGKTFMEQDKFKVRDVDEIKRLVLKVNDIKKKFPEVSGMDLRKAEDVGNLHMFVKRKGFNDKSLELLLSDLKQGHLPNIMFDITGKHVSDITQYLPMLHEVGYDQKNIHLVWILSDYKVAYKANQERSRVVPEDILIQTHVGAAKTMQSIIDREKLPRGMDGSFHVILNNRENTKFYQVGDVVRGKVITSIPLTKGGHPINVKDFDYITLKREGKPFRKATEWSGDFRQKLADAINANAPKDIEDGERGIKSVKGG